MPSAAKTSNLGLSKWTGSERLKRQDIIDDNEILDAAIGDILAPEIIEEMRGMSVAEMIIYLQDRVLKEDTALTVSLTTENPVQSTASEVENGQGVEVTVNGSFRGNFENQNSVDVTTADVDLSTVTLKANTTYHLSALIDMSLANGTERCNIRAYNTTTFAYVNGNEISGTGKEYSEVSFTTSSTDLSYLVQVNVTNAPTSAIKAVTEVLLEEATERLPFIEGVQALTNLLVSCTGENLIDANGLFLGSYDINGNLVRSSESANLSSEDYVKIDSSKQYTISTVGSTVSVNVDQFLACEYDANKTFLRRNGFTGTGAEKTVIFSADAKYVRVYAYRILEDDSNISDINNAKLSLVEGSTAPTEYKPYVESKDLYEGELMALPDGTKDILRWLTDGTCEKDKWIKKLVFDGSEEWGGFSSILTDVCRATISNFTTDNKLDRITSRGLSFNDDGIIIVNDTGDVDYEHLALYSDEGLYLYINKAKISAMPSGLTQAGFQEYLASKNVTAWFKRDVTDPTETISTGKAITTHTGEKCTFSVASGIVEREKVVPYLNTLNTAFHINNVGYANADDNPFSKKVERVIDIWKERLIDDTLVSVRDTENWTFTSDDLAYGGMRAYILDELVETDDTGNPLWNYYVDYEMLHSEYDNQQVNASISYKQNTHDAIDYANQAISRIDGQQSLNTKQIAEMVAPEEVFNPTLLNGWIHGSTNRNVSYSKDVLGMVHLSGLMQGGTTTTDTVVFTLPEDYRPLGVRVFSVRTYSGSDIFGAIKISSNGEVSVSASSASGTNLDGISFKAGR